MAQLVKNPPAMQETWVGKIPWKRERLWKRKWQPTPVLLPGKSLGQRSLVGYSLWGRKKLDMTERLYLLTYLPTPVFWRGEFHGLYSPWGRKESDDWATFSLSFVSEEPLWCKDKGTKLRHLLDFHQICSENFEIDNIFVTDKRSLAFEDYLTQH